MQQLKCPYCNSTITSSTYKKVLAKIRKEGQEQFRRAKERLEIKLRKHYEMHFAEEKKSLERAKRRIEETRHQLVLERKELRNKEKNLKKGIEAQLKLKYHNQLVRERDKIDKEKRRLAEREYELKNEHEDIIRSYRKRQDNLKRTIDSQKAIIERLEQEAQRKSLAELGDIPEEKLIDSLQQTFPDDKFERIRKGRAGGDVIQNIMYHNNLIGKILYESKNDKNWKNKWLSKIKQDASAVGTTYAILVSKAFPRGTKHFVVIKSVIVVSPRLLSHIAGVIRTAILTMEKQKLSAFQMEEKISALYSYLNSADFQSSVIAIEDGLQQLNALRTDEMRTHEKTWTTEERLINKVIMKQFTQIVSNIEAIIETEKMPLLKKKTTSAYA